jgi:hypothetical protein
MMTEYQRVAAKFPCYLAVETTHPRFAHALSFGSLVLTINSGYE